MSKLSLTLHTFSVTGSVAGLFLTLALNNTSFPQDESEAINNPNIYSQQEFYVVSLPYNINQLVKPNAWDSETCSISVFGIMEFLKIDSKNMFTLLLCMANYIRNKKVKKGKINDVSELKGFSEAA